MLRRLVQSIVLGGLVLFVGSTVWSQGLPITAHPDTSGWTDLFAPDLSNAIFEPGGWVMEDGVLRAEDHGTIWSRESFGDFVLDLEFKVAKDANSGVFLRTGDIQNILSAIEVQVHETKDGGKYGMVGALYDLKPPSKNVAKPAGEWNRYTITCNDSRIYLVFNGEQVINVDLAVTVCVAEARRERRYARPEAASRPRTKDPPARRLRPRRQMNPQ